MNKKKGLLTQAMQAAILFFFMGLLVEGFSYTWVRSRGHLTIQAIASEKILHQKRTKIRKRLTVERAHLTSPRIIAERAKQELGLKRPTPDQILRVRNQH